MDLLVGLVGGAAEGEAGAGAAGIGGIGGAASKAALLNKQAQQAPGLGLGQLLGMDAQQSQAFQQANADLSAKRRQRFQNADMMGMSDLF